MFQKKQSEKHTEQLALFLFVPPALGNLSAHQGLRHESQASLSRYCKSHENRSLRPRRTGVKKRGHHVPFPQPWMDSPVSCKVLKGSNNPARVDFTRLLHRSSPSKCPREGASASRTTCSPPSEVPTAPTCQESVGSPPMKFFEKSGYSKQTRCQ